MKRFALALIVLSSPAFAEQLPTPSSRDSRVRTVPYDPQNIVRLETADLRSTMLQFSIDETVDIVALGDPTGWAFNKARNLLFLKPTLSPSDPGYAARSRSNMQVVTLKPNGDQRIYEFELIATATVEKPLLSLTVTYPGDVAAARRKIAAEAKEKHDEDVARQRLIVGFYYGSRNWQYAGRGSTSIEPANVSDDGKNTAFRFLGNSPQPAVWQGSCDEKDRLANTSNPLPDTVEAQGISPFWCLRLGTEVFEVASARYNAAGFTTNTGTTSPDVVRNVRRSPR